MQPRPDSEGTLPPEDHQGVSDPSTAVQRLDDIEDRLDKRRDVATDALAKIHELEERVQELEEMVDDE